jgi:5'/3'-nucleotidase
VRWTRRRIRFLGIVGTISALMLGPSTVAHAGVNGKASGPVLRILATNDDGPTTPGLGVLVQALLKVPNAKVVVSMVSTNQSGTDSKTTPGPLTAVRSTTTAGYPAYSVNGTPADAVNWALSNLPRPTLVVSGVNDGQNIGFFTTLSGTVGAARTAARAGIPALAVSQGLGNTVPYELAAGYAVSWIKQHRSAILHRKKGAPVLFDNLDVPTCTAGSVRGVVVVPVAHTAVNAFAPPDCPSNDIEAFVEGFAPISHLMP